MLDVVSFSLHFQRHSDQNVCLQFTTVSMEPDLRQAFSAKFVLAFTNRGEPVAFRLVSLAWHRESRAASSDAIMLRRCLNLQALEAAFVDILGANIVGRGQPSSVIATCSNQSVRAIS